VSTMIAVPLHMYVATLVLQVLKTLLAHTLVSFPGPHKHFVVCTVSGAALLGYQLFTVRLHM